MRIKFTKYGPSSPGALIFCDDDGKEIISLNKIESFKAVHGKDGTYITLMVNETVPVEIEVRQ